MELDAGNFFVVDIRVPSVTSADQVWGFLYVVKGERLFVDRYGYAS